MKIISSDYKKGNLKAKIDSLDDLWTLTYIIEKGDSIRAKTYRKIKLGKEDDRNQKVVKKETKLTLRVDKVEFSKFNNLLRVSGIIEEGPEDIPLGSHHTINLEETGEFSLIKEHFLKYQIDKIEESAKDTKSRILVCVHDREEAYFAMLKKYGYEVLTSIKGNVTKKSDFKMASEDFFPIIKKTIEEYDQRYDFSNIVIASPGFWREYIMRIITEEQLKKKIVYATCSTVGESGINEVMKRPEVQTVLKQEKFAAETEKVEELLSEIAKRGMAEYGKLEVAKAVDSGAVRDLLIADELIQKARQEDRFGEIDALMRKADTMGAKISIISSEHEAGKKLGGLGGIGAILRYRISY